MYRSRHRSGAAPVGRKSWHYVMLFVMYELIITNENLGPKEDAGLNQSLILFVMSFSRHVKVSVRHVMSFSGITSWGGECTVPYGYGYGAANKGKRTDTSPPGAGPAGRTDERTLCD